MLKGKENKNINFIHTIVINDVYWQLKLLYSNKLFNKFAFSILGEVETK